VSEERFAEDGTGACEAETGDQNNEVKPELTAQGRYSDDVCSEGRPHCAKVFRQQEPTP
jgi:hypothetical protein